jgi:hypothetical protein
MKYKIQKLNKQNILESVFENIKRNILDGTNIPVTGDTGDVENQDQSEGSNGSEMSADKNLFAGQRSSNTYTGNHIVNDAKATIGK